MSQRVACYGCRAGYKERREQNNMHLGATAMRGKARLSAVSRVRTIMFKIENTFDNHGEFLHTWWCFFPCDCNQETSASYVNWSCTNTPPPLPYVCL